MPKQTERNPMAAAKPAAAKTAAQAKTTTTRTRKPRSRNISPAQRYEMIAEAAYLLAEQDGFNPSHALDHWLAAEASIDAQFGGQIAH